MNAEVIMSLIEKYFADKQPGVKRETLPAQPVTSLLQDSLDLVDFLVFLEEELKLGYEIDMNRFGPSVMNKNFEELSRLIADFLLAERQSTAPQ